MSTAPSPTRVDELALDYLALKEKHFTATLAVRDLQGQLSEKAEVLRALVREHGSAHAEKSKLLHGISHEIMATFGQQIEVDFAAVEKFRTAASEALKPAQFTHVFEKVISYRLLASAAEYVRTNKLPQKLKALYAACQVIKEKTPALFVRPKEKAA